MPLANDARGVVARSVQALADLPADLPAAAVVGGLAVMVRLYEAHRVTTDFDEVSQGRDLAIATLVSLGATRTSSGVRLPDRDVQLDLLDAETPLVALASLDTSAMDDHELRGWQLAMVNRYALDTAVVTDIFVIDVASDAIAARVSIPVAVAGALVAMKVQAALSPDRNRLKVASDVYDTWRMIRAWGPSVIAEDLSRAPVPMLQRTIDHVRTLFSDDVDRTARWLATASVPGVASVDADALEGAVAVADLLEPFVRWDPAT